MGNIIKSVGVENKNADVTLNKKKVVKKIDNINEKNKQDKIKKYEKKLVKYKEKIKKLKTTYDEFKLNDMNKSPAILIIGNRNCGKSTLCMNFIEYFKTIGIKDGEIISSSDKLANFYGNQCPKINIQYEYKNEIVKDLLDNKLSKINSKYFIFDDCMTSQNDWTKDEHFLELLCKNKYFNVPVIFVQQFAHGFSKEMINKFDYVFLFEEKYDKAILRLYDLLGNNFENYEHFKKTLYDLTNNYFCLVIDNKNKQIKWFKSKLK